VIEHWFQAAVVAFCSWSSWLDIKEQRSLRRAVQAGGLVVLCILGAAAPAEAAVAIITNVTIVPSLDRGLPDIVVYAQGPIGPIGVVGDPGSLLQITIENAQLATGRAIRVQDSMIQATASLLSPTKVVLALKSAVTFSVSAEHRPEGLRVHLSAARRPQAVEYSQPAFGANKELGPSEQLTVIRMKYADVSEVAGILVAGSNISSNDVFSPASSPLVQGAGGLSTVGTSAPIYETTSGSQQANGAVGERLSDTIAIDRRLNALVVIADERTTAKIRKAVESLDIPVASVLLETEIVELTDSAARNVGFDYSASGSIAAATFTAQSQQLPSGALSLQARVLAEVTKGQGKILAKPSILALDGRTASILTGDQIPIITTLSFPSSGSSVVQQQIQYLTVGVNLQIRPQISADGVVTTHLYANVSSVTGFIQNYPQVAQRFASTVASVRNGQSLVIGGLLQDTELRSFTKVPFLGDLPLLGQLFRLSKSTRQHTNLYIVVTPHIVAMPG